MSALDIVGIVGGIALYLSLGAILGYHLAPSVGYRSPEERDEWRRFGWNWGILAVVICWLFDRFGRDLGWAFHPLASLFVIGIWVLLALLLPRWSAGLPWLVLVWIVAADNRHLVGTAVRATSLLTFMLGPIGYGVHAVRRPVIGPGRALASSV